MIVDGTPAPTDILNILGIEALAEYMVREVQKVYRLQGVLIDDKHIECITRQMLQKVEVIGAGDSDYLVGDVKDKIAVVEKNNELKKEGKKEVDFKMMILGITKQVFKPIHLFQQLLSKKLQEFLQRQQSMVKLIS